MRTPEQKSSRIYFMKKDLFASQTKSSCADTY